MEILSLSGTIRGATFDGQQFWGDGEAEPPDWPDDIDLRLRYTTTLLGVLASICRDLMQTPIEDLCLSHQGIL
jgi:hypothetical protein